MRHKILSSSRTSGVGGRVGEEFRSCCRFLEVIFLMLLKNFVAAYQSLRDFWVSLLKLLLFKLLFKYFIFLI